MDDGEIEFSPQGVFPSSNMVDQLPSSCSMDSFFEEILKDTHACTHTHTCNPPGPDATHTHTCFHVHTKILPSHSGDDHIAPIDDSAESTEKTSKKRSVGNREAVRKYREKKKARAASLEDEVLRLRALNQQLMKKLQGQPALEAEITRLRCLLVDIRGRIEGEIGCFPYQKIGKGGNNGVLNSMNSQPDLSDGFVLNSCELRCDDQLNCLHPSLEAGGVNVTGFGACDISDVQCGGNVNIGIKELSACSEQNQNVRGFANSYINKRKGGRTPLDG